MDRPQEYYAKWNKSDRERNTMWSHLYVQEKQQQNTQKLSFRSEKGWWLAEVWVGLSEEADEIGGVKRYTKRQLQNKPWGCDAQHSD